MSSLVLHVTVLLLFLVKQAECACTFPGDLTGTWISSDKGSLTFTSTTLTGYDTKYGTLSFDCESSSGNNYVAKSPTFTYHQLTLQAYLCFVFISQSSYKFVYYLGSNRSTEADNERIKISGSTLSQSDVCDRPSFDSASYNILIKNGSVSSAVQTCPYIVQGQWTYTYDSGSGSLLCGGSNSSLDVCTSTNLMTFSYSKCSQQILYSAGGQGYCVHSTTYGSTTYLTVYNTDASVDDTATYRYTCLAITESGTTRFITQYPNECVEDQSSTNISSPGAYLVFYQSSTCSSDSSSSVSAASIALGVLVPFTVIVITIIVIFFVWQYKQKKKMEEASRPDPKFRNGEVANRRRNVHDGVVNSKHDQNGNMVRRDSSIILSLPSSSRGNDVMSPRSGLDTFDEDFDIDDSNFAINEIDRANIPEIVVDGASPQLGIGEGAAKNSGKKKKKRRKTGGTKQGSRKNTVGRRYRKEGGSHLDTSDKLAFGTTLVLLKLPTRHKKKGKKKAKKEDGQETTLTNQTSVQTFETVTELQAPKKSTKVRKSKTPRTPDDNTEKARAPILRHPMENHAKDKKVHNARSNGWVVHRSGSRGEKFTRFPENPVVSTSEDVQRSTTLSREAQLRQNWCYDDKSLVSGSLLTW